MQFGTEAGREGTGDTGRRRKGFFGSLFDLSFTSFITARVVKFVYVVSLIFVVLYVISTTGYLSFVVYAFTAGLADSEAAGVVAGVVLFLVLLPILLLVSMIYVRVVLEIVIVLFRISEDTAELAHLARTLSDRQTPPPQDPPTTEKTPGQ